MSQGLRRAPQVVGAHGLEVDAGGGHDLPRVVHRGFRFSLQDAGKAVELDFHTLLFHGLLSWNL